MRLVLQLAHSGPGSLDVYDTATRTRIDSIEVGRGPLIGGVSALSNRPAGTGSEPRRERHRQWHAGRLLSPNQLMVVEVRVGFGLA